MFHAWENQGSSLLNVLMPDGFLIAPRWIRPTLTASLTATECLLASESAEIAPVRLHSCNVVSTPGIRWVRWGGRGDEMRLRGVVIRSPGTDQTLATGGGRPTSVHRHRSRVVWHSADEGTLYSSTAWICVCRLQRCTAAGGRCAPLKSADTGPSTARAKGARIFIN